MASPTATQTDHNQETDPEFGNLLQISSNLSSDYVSSPWQSLPFRLAEHTIADEISYMELRSMLIMSLQIATLNKRINAQCVAPPSFLCPLHDNKVQEFSSLCPSSELFSMERCNIMGIYSIFCLQVLRKEQPWCILLLVLKITLKLTVDKWQSKGHIQHCSKESNFYLQMKDRPGAQASLSSQVYKTSFS